MSLDSDKMLEAIVGLFRTLATALIQSNPARARELIRQMREACAELSAAENEQRRTG